MVTVRQSALDPNRWYFSFDIAAPGGYGGAAILLEPGIGLVSIDGVHCNRLMPRRSTGMLLAEGLIQIGMAKPSILEMYNVQEASTYIALATGDDGFGTLLGNTLQDIVLVLGGTIIRWETIPNGKAFDLRVHVHYP